MRHWKTPKHETVFIMKCSNRDGRARERPAVALVFPGDSTDPSASSGTPFSLANALEGLGVEVVRIRGRAPRIMERAAMAVTVLRWLASAECGAGSRGGSSPRAGIEVTMMRSGFARMRLLGLQPAGIVQLGSEFLIESRAPLATFEDQTIRQALDSGYFAWHLGPRDIAWRLDRQRRIYNRATVCCTRSNWAARSITQDYGVTPSKLRVIGLGPNRPAAPVARAWDPPRFLFVGKDWERKNGPLLIDTFRQLRAELPTARLDVVGGHPRIDCPGVVGHGPLHMREPDDQAHLAALFSEATCFVLPSHYEPMGISYVEASAAGLPSIGTCVGGCRDVISQSGRVVDPSKPGQLLNAMRELADPKVAAAAGAQALIDSRRYTWPRVAERLLLALDIRPPGTKFTEEFLNDADLRPAA